MAVKMERERERERERQTEREGGWYMFCLLASGYVVNTCQVIG